MSTLEKPSLKSIKEAAEIVRKDLQVSPMIQTVHPLTGEPLWMKLESTHRTGSFKERGACFKLSHLKNEGKGRRVVATSAGNHSQALSYHGKRLGFEVHICMPKLAPLTKVVATQSWGANVRLTGNSFLEAMNHGKALAGELKAPFVSAFDDPYIISGQGTCGLEILDQLENLDLVIVPVGGGGLASGLAMAIKELKPSCRIIGVQAENCSLVARNVKGADFEGTPGSGVTIADGIAIKALGDITIPLMQKYLDDVVLVSEDEIVAGVKYLLQSARILAEGAGAAGLAAIAAEKISTQGKKTAFVMSGGNIDLTLISRILEKTFFKEGRVSNLDVLISDRPGGLNALTEVLADVGASILQIHHERAAQTIPMFETSVHLVLETRDGAHVAQIKTRLKEEGFKLA